MRGPSIATGYWSRTEATQAAFRGDWLRTGDVYTRSADGYWTFLGRNSDMIKAGGIWVSPAEVESVLIEHPDVLEAAVVGARDDGRAGDRPWPSSCPQGRPHDRRRRDRRPLPRARWPPSSGPRQVVVVDELPKTATGKIQRFALRAQLVDPA